MKRSKPLNRISPERLAEHGGKMPFSSIAAKPKKIRAKRRKPSEFARIYGSKERVAWVQAQKSVASGKRPCENVHTETGGMGYKAGYQTIVPLTREEHQELHQHGVVAFEAKYGLSLSFHAAQINLRWQNLPAVDQ